MGVTANQLNRVQQLYSKLSPADAVLLGQTPALMMPRFSPLPDLMPGCRRYIVARDGLYVQACSRLLSVTLCAEKFHTALPYGNLDESVSLSCGILPSAIYEELRDRAIAAFPDEWAAYVVYDGAFRIVEPKVISRSGGHVSYRMNGINEDQIILDIHSHGRHDAFFSHADDRTDMHGVYLASVFGKCGNAENITCKSRIVIDGYHREIDWNPWEDA